jgi:predicted DNA-binding protein (UPF0251 family)
MANPNQDARNGKGKYTRTIETAEQDAQAARLFSQGLNYREIGEQLGVSKWTAMRSVQRAVQAVVQDAGQEAIRVHASRLEYAYAKAIEIAEADHVMVSHGKVICDEDGKPLRDHAPVLAALREARQTLDSFRIMMGLNQPVKVDATVHQVTQQDVELQEMLREAKARTQLEEQQILDGGANA